MSYEICARCGEEYELGEDGLCVVCVVCLDAEENSP